VSIRAQGNDRRLFPPSCGENIIVSPGNSFIQQINPAAGRSMCVLNSWRARLSL